VTTVRPFLWLAVVMLAVVAGVVGLPGWGVITIGALAMLWLRGPGQADPLRARSGKPRFNVIALSMGTLECGVAWSLGAGMRWLAMANAV
jgi:hypothetical protein